MRRVVLAFTCLMLGSAVRGQVPWHTDLFNAGDDLWRTRTAVELRNTGPGALKGYPVAIPVGTGENAIDLVGAPAGELRVCQADGAELLFDLRGPDGERIEDGPIPAGATLSVPLAAEAGGSQTVYIYRDNPSAYRVPDFLQGAAGAVNGGFEDGQGAVPTGWTFDAQPNGRLEWSTETPHSGRRCVKTIVPAGNEPSWIAHRQLNLAIMPGARYRITAWVKGENIVGYAGWYCHVATPDNPMKLGPLVRAGEGTFDWRPITIEFTAPEDAIRLSHGTVLWGTGTAWFDDARVECLDPPAATYAVGGTERLELDERRLDGAWFAADGRVWEARAPVRVANVGDEIRSALVQFRATPLLTRLRRGFRPQTLRVVDPDTNRVLPHLVSGDDVLFLADLPARCVKEYAVYISRDAGISEGPSLAYADLVNSPGNLIRNPSFEDGDGGPADWPGATEGRDEATARMTRERGGVVGDWCVRLAVPDAAPAAWVGWRQPVGIVPGATYFVAAQVRCQGVRDGQVRIHGHFHDAAGQLAGQRYWSTPGAISGDTDWTVLSGTAQSGFDTVDFTVHLTTNTHGTIEHDGVVMMRTCPAALGGFAQREDDAGPLSVWAENPIVKVFQDSTAGDLPERITLAAARGEEECFQLALRANRPLAKVKVTAEALRGAGGMLSMRVERVGYVPCLQPSGYFSSTAEPWQRHKARGDGRTDGWRGWWPDYLVPMTGPLDLAADTTQPLWLTVSIPPEAQPGDYDGMVRVEAPGLAPVAVPVRLTVWRFTLPERPTLQVIYDLRNGPGWSLFRSDADWEKWWRFMARRRVATDRVPGDPAIRLVDGKVTIDTTAWDRRATLLYDELKCSGGYWPGWFYACGWAHPPRDLFGLKYPSPEHKAVYQEAVRLFQAHLKEKGWDRLLSLYVSDEPHYSHPEVVQWLGDVIRYAREVDPEIRVYSSTWGHVPAWDGILNHWGIAQYGGFPMDVAAERRAAGDKLWFTTDGQMEIDTPYNACERLLPYYCLAHEVDGYEFWGFSWYTYDPYLFGWHSFIHQSSAPGEWSWVRYPNGDGYLAYPGEPLGFDEPLSTVRLEQAREGIEDYEYLAALKDLAARRPEARGEIDRILAEVSQLAFIPNRGGYRSTDILPDPDRLLEIRRHAGELLDRLLR